MWRAAARAAGIGNRLLTVMAGLLVSLMLTYGTYSLWDTYPGEPKRLCIRRTTEL